VPEEVVVPTPLVLRAVHELEHALHTGRIGDGEIFVGPVDQAIRVRTGERGEDALQAIAARRALVSGLGTPDAYPGPVLIDAGHS
jgi:hypothetical protein